MDFKIKHHIHMWQTTSVTSGDRSRQESVVELIVAEISFVMAS